VNYRARGGRHKLPTKRGYFTDLKQHLGAKVNLHPLCNPSCPAFKEGPPPSREEDDTDMYGDGTLSEGEVEAEPPAAAAAVQQPPQARHFLPGDRVKILRSNQVGYAVGTVGIIARCDPNTIHGYLYTVRTGNTRVTNYKAADLELCPDSNSHNTTNDQTLAHPLVLPRPHAFQIGDHVAILNFSGTSHPAGSIGVIVTRTNRSNLEMKYGVFCNGQTKHFHASEIRKLGRPADITVPADMVVAQSPSVPIQTPPTPAAAVATDVALDTAASSVPSPLPHTATKKRTHESLEDRLEDRLGAVVIESAAVNQTPIAAVEKKARTEKSTAATSTIASETLPSMFFPEVDKARMNPDMWNAYFAFASRSSTSVYFLPPVDADSMTPDMWIAYFTFAVQHKQTPA
jgi:hypothetical protein